MTDLTVALRAYANAQLAAAQTFLKALPIVTQPWQARSQYYPNDSVQLPNGVVLNCAAAGISGATAPTGAGIDGTVSWVGAQL